MAFWRSKKRPEAPPSPPPRRQPKPLVPNAAEATRIRKLNEFSWARNPQPSTTPLAAGSSTAPNPYLHPDRGTAQDIRPAGSSSSTRPVHRPVHTVKVTIRCKECDLDLAYRSQVISWAFSGRHGRCMLVAPPKQLALGKDPDIYNVELGASEERTLDTGLYTVAPVSCLRCDSYLGWRYVDVGPPSEKYKQGKYCIEEACTYISDERFDWQLGI